MAQILMAAMAKALAATAVMRVAEPESESYFLSLHPAALPLK